MKYCPNCKTEYENEATICADCKVDLVNSLEDINTDKMLIVLNSSQDVLKVTEYLEYSGIKTLHHIKNEEEDNEFVLYVDEKEYVEASKFMKGYFLSEKKPIDEEEYFFNEYETMDIELTDEINEAKNSYLTFIILGLSVSAFSILNLTNTINLLSGIAPIVLLVTGIAFISVGIYTKNSIKTKTAKANANKEIYDIVMNWYKSNYPLDNFFHRNSINLDNLDEGAKFFAIMDKVVNECKHCEETDNELLINTVSENIVNELIK